MRLPRNNKHLKGLKYIYIHIFSHIQKKKK